MASAVARSGTRTGVPAHDAPRRSNRVEAGGWRLDIGYRMTAALLVCSWSTSSGFSGHEMRIVKPSRFESNDDKREGLLRSPQPPKILKIKIHHSKQATARACLHYTRNNNRHNLNKQTLFSSVTSSSGRTPPASAQAERSRQANDRPSWSTPSISSTCRRLLRREESEQNRRLFSTSTTIFDKPRSGSSLIYF